MFTWICPKCGREVPPSYDECPDCAARAKAPETAAVEQQTPAAPPPAPPTAAPQAPPAPRRPAPQPRPGLPTWLMSILFALAFIGLGLGIYWLIGYYRDRGQGPAQPAVALETPGKKTSPVQKYIEITGIRFLQNAKKQTEARFLVVNHSPDLIADIAGTVVVWGRTQKSDEESVGSFGFKLPTIGPWEAKELSAPMDTRLRVYELPDWQNVTAELQLTSP